MKPFVTVIMPAYNAENQIDRIISSIIDQTMENWELFIIDDCSTDGTVDKINKWVEKDKRISLIELKVNAGPGHAKNLGLSKATGKYITFCDADDWIEKDAFAAMSQNEKEDADVIVAGYYRDLCDSNNNMVERNLICVSPWQTDKKKEIIQGVVTLDRARLFSFAWNKLYKTELVKKNTICFSDKKFGEDYDFNLTFFTHCESIEVLNKAFYHYIKQNSESLTERFVPDFYEINKERFEKMCDLMRMFKCYSGQTRSAIMNLYIKHVLSAIARLYDKRGHVSGVERRHRVRYMLNERISKDALQYSKATCRSEKICNAVFKTNCVSILLFFGWGLWIVQTKGKKIYEKVK